MQQKTPVVVGNSLAFVIEKPLCRMLGIGRKTLLRVTTDGRRLVLEPVGIVPDKPPVITGPAEYQDALSVFVALERQHLMNRLQWDRLTQGYRYMRHLADLQVDSGKPLAGEELARVRRLKHCLQSLQAGHTWVEAIDAALEAFPVPPVPGTTPTADTSSDDRSPPCHGS